MSRESEWPPSPFVLPVYSSETKRWEERSFVRQGNAAGTIADLLEEDRLGLKRYGVYLRGALYVPRRRSPGGTCRGGYEAEEMSGDGCRSLSARADAGAARCTC
ncbi:hypothetical protein ZWY2020_008786 [Hordeum vulgare]|nr:hypothetical protein ZWY2020_008786 [Hordeum vulgare]